MGVELAPLAEVPVEEVLDLVALCLGEAAVERSEAFWRWKHETNPFGRSLGLVALADGRPVALRAFMRWRWRAGGETVEAVRAVDTATHPDWQRRGLFRRLTLRLCEECAELGIRLVFNTPNAVSRRGYLALGWQDAGRLPLLVRPRRPARLLAALLRRRDPVEGEADRDDPVAKLRPVAELLGLPALAAWLSDAAVDGDPRWRTDRSLDYLLWRYAAAPGLEYRALWEEGEEASSGAGTVLRLRRRRGLDELAVVEWFASSDPAGTAAARRLVARIATMPAIDHAVAVAAPGSLERQPLRAAGFLPARLLAPRLTVRLLGGAGALSPDPRRIASWRPSAGDLELF